MEAIIKLGDEKDYVLSTLNVGDLIEIEKKFGSLTFDTTKLEVAVYWIWLGFKKKHPELTLDGLYQLLDMRFTSNGGLNSIFAEMSKVNGWEKGESKNP